MSDTPGDQVVAHAPGRVNLIGDHTDHAGGLALPMAVDLGTTVVGRRGGGEVVLRSSARDGVARLALIVDDPAATSPSWARHPAAVVAELRPEEGFVGQVHTTLPLGAGLSSSAALGVALALALGFVGERRELARLAQRSEQRATGVPCGLMDQLTSVCGVAGHCLLMDFSTDAVEAVPVPDGLEVLVVHSGQERALDRSAYAERRAQCEAAAFEVGPLAEAALPDIERLTDPLLRRRARHVATEVERVRRAADALRAGDGATVGTLMGASHASLRDDFEVSTPALDETARRLMDIPGVLGARLTGAGFGGCVVALTEAGAVPDPAAVTGRGWRVHASDGARVTSGRAAPSSWPGTRPR